MIKACRLILVCILLAGCSGGRNIRTDDSPSHDGRPVDRDCPAGEVWVKLKNGGYGCKPEKELCPLNKKPVFEGDGSFKCAGPERHSEGAPYGVYLIEGLMLLLML